MVFIRLKHFNMHSLKKPNVTLPWDYCIVTIFTSLMLNVYIYMLYFYTSINTRCFLIKMTDFLCFDLIEVFVRTKQNILIVLQYLINT